MRRMIAAALAALAACADRAPEPTAAMAGGDAAVLLQLGDGRALYVDKCSGCHALVPADRFADRDWAAKVEAHRDRKLRLSPAERDRVLLYLAAANGRD